MRRQAQWCTRSQGCAHTDTSLTMIYQKRDVEVPKHTFADLIAKSVQDSEPVTALAYSPDGSRIYTASRSLQQRAWDVESARTLRTWKVCPLQGCLLGI
jgi:WD40 repeat protein